MGTGKVVVSAINNSAHHQVLAEKEVNSVSDVNYIADATYVMSESVATEWY